MPIPPLNDDGLLPDGIYECTLEEIGERFARFQRTDRRIRLFARLTDYAGELRKTGLAVALIIDGSFTTAKDEPDDIDLILILPAGHDFGAELRPFEYNAITKPGVRRFGYPFDLLVVEEGSAAYDRRVDLYRSVRNSPIRKGVLRVSLR